MIKPLQFWCQKVLPLVYDESLSYYELLCKVAEKLNELIQHDSEQDQAIQEIKQAINQLQEWIDNFDTTVIEQIVREYLATMIFVSISDGGYIIYTIPDTWKSITFNTTGLDIFLPLQPEYGHLVLSY